MCIRDSSGRNFEYFSSDPFVAGTIVAAEVQGIQSKGVYVYLKHVALNDSETSRRGVNTWLNEQTAREIYLDVYKRQPLRPFCQYAGPRH